MPSERDYAERLREQSYKTLSPQISELEEEVKDLSNSLSTRIYQIERKLEAISKIDLPSTDIVLDEILEDVYRQKDEEEKSIISFAHDIRRKETQEEILGLLLDYAHEFFPRVALFAVRKDRFSGWSSRGFSEESARDIAGCSFPCAEYPRFQETLESEEITAAPDLPDDSSPNFLRDGSSGAGYLVPLHALQRPVALLYVEEAGEKRSRRNTLSILTDLTVFRLENIALKILYTLTEGRTSASQPVQDTAPEPASAGPELSETAEQAAEQAAEAAEPSSIPQSDSEVPVEQQDVPAPVEETIEAGEAAEAQGNKEPAAETQEDDAGATTSPEAVSEADEERLHADARKFARLLISEIKLYNENHIAEGRANRDLYIRLKRDIDKSREMYENRVSPIVSQKIDYFHDEMVRILGDNDPSTLGSDYPGPRVDN